MTKPYVRLDKDNAAVLLALGAKFALAFFVRQRRATHPLLPLSLFAHPAYAAVSFLALSTGVALYAAVVFLPQYLQIGLHLSPTGSAWHLAPQIGRASCRERV